MPNHHHIQKSTIRLELPTSADNFQRQEMVSRFFWERIVPKVEQLMDRFVGEEELVKLDRLDIGLQFDSWLDLEENFVPVLMKALEEQLDLSLVGQQAGVDRQTIPEAQFRSWLQFLERGYNESLERLSPESLDQFQKHLIQQLRESSNAQAELKDLLLQRPLARQRLVKQYNFDFVASLLKVYFLGSLKRYIDFASALPGFLKLIQQTDAKQTRSIFKPSFLKDPTTHLSTHLIEAVITNATRQSDDGLMLYAILNGLKQKGDAKILLVLTKELLRNRLSDLPISRSFIQQFGTLLTKVTSGESAALEVNKAQSEKDLPAEELAGKPNAKSNPADASIESKEDAGSIEDTSRSTGKEPDTTSVPDEATLAESSLVNERMDAQDQEPSNEESSIDRSSTIESGAPGAVDVQEDGSGLTQGGLTSGSLPAEPPQTTSEHGTHYINHAGLLLLHPYLPQFFRVLELLDNKAFIDEVAQEKAVHLLHYLAAKTTSLPEYQLLFPKLLCGLPFEIPISRGLELNANETAEAEGLLTAVIQHWGALGASGPDALREGFLQRSGKLSWKKNHWEVIVEKKTIDILLTKLPWGYGMIKLPWMKERITVNWG